MALYFYQAFSKDGRKVTGYLDATSVQAVKDQLATEGIILQKSNYLAKKLLKKVFTLFQVYLKDVLAQR